MISLLKIISFWLIKLEIWIVVGLIGISVMIPILLPYATIGIVFFLLLRWFVFKRITVRTPADIAVILLLITVITTLGITIIPEKSSSQFYRLLSGVWLYYAVINWTNSSKRLRKMVYLIFSAGFALTIVSPFITQWQNKIFLLTLPISGQLRAIVSDTANPNVIAGIVSILIPVMAGYLLYGWREIKNLEKVLVTILLFLMGVIVILTQSRGAWLALLLGMLFLLSFRWRWVWIFTSSILLSISLLVGFSTNALNLLFLGSKLQSLAERVNVWSRGIMLLQDFPFTGIGIGTFDEVVHALYPLQPNQMIAVDHVHNLFLQIGIDLGVTGLIAWLSIYFIVLLVAWKISSKKNRVESKWINGLGRGLLGSQIVLGIHGLIDCVVWGMVRPAPAVWFLWAMTFAIYQYYYKKQADKIQLTT